MREEGNWEQETSPPPGFPSSFLWLLVISSFCEFHLSSTNGSVKSSPFTPPLTFRSSNEPLKSCMPSSSGGRRKDGDEVAAPWALQVTHCSWVILDIWDLYWKSFEPVFPTPEGGGGGGGGALASKPVHLLPGKIVLMHMHYLLHL